MYTVAIQAFRRCDIFVILTGQQRLPIMTGKTERLPVDGQKGRVIRFVGIVAGDTVPIGNRFVQHGIPIGERLMALGTMTLGA